MKNLILFSFLLLSLNSFSQILHNMAYTDALNQAYHFKGYSNASFDKTPDGKPIIYVEEDGYVKSFYFENDICFMYTILVTDLSMIAKIKDRFDNQYTKRESLKWKFVSEFGQMIYINFKIYDTSFCINYSKYEN